MMRSKKAPSETSLQPENNNSPGRSPIESAFESPVTFDDLIVSVGKTRNRDSFIRLFEYFAPRVKSFLMRGGLAPEQADELAQETMLTVWHRAKNYDPAKAQASTWIFTIARNKKIDYLRKMKLPEPELTDPMLADEDVIPPDEAANRSQQQEAIAQALKKLPPEQAELVQKAYFEDMTHSEIAEETGLPLGTVKSRLRLAMDRLHYNLQELKP